MSGRTPDFRSDKNEVKSPEANPAKLALRIRELDVRIKKLEDQLAELFKRGEKNVGTTSTGK